MQQSAPVRDQEPPWSLENIQITELNLSNTNIGDSGARALANFLRNNPHQINDNIGSQSARTLADEGDADDVSFRRNSAQGPGPVQDQARPPSSAQQNRPAAQENQSCLPCCVIS